MKALLSRKCKYYNPAKVQLIFNIPNLYGEKIVSEVCK